MTDATEQPQFVWTCQKCGRKLPTRLDICRCGTRRAPGSPEEPVSVPVASPKGPALRTEDAPIERSPGPSGPGMMNWIVLFAVAAIVVGALVAIQVVPVKKAPAASTSADGSTSPLPAQPATPAPSGTPSQDYT